MSEWKASLCNTSGPFMPKATHRIQVFIHIAFCHLVLIASSILPATSPPVLPLRAIKLALPQLYVDSVMSFAHPASKFFPAAHARRIPILLHPVLEITRAMPTWVQLREYMQERFCVGLKLRGRLDGISSRDGVEERPGAAAQSFDVGRAVGGDRERGG